MGFRFRRTVRIVPGVRMNLTAKGCSFSIGGRGSTVNFSRDGVRRTLSLIGTGVSYTKYVKWGGGKPTVLVVVALVFYVLFRLVR